LKSKRLQPSDFKYSEQDQQKMDSQPPPVAPAVQAAQINQKTQLTVATMKQQGDQQSIASEEKIAQAERVLEGQKTQVGATIDLHEMEHKRQMLILEYALKHGITVTQAKTELAQTAMKLTTQKELNEADNALELHRHHNPGAEAVERLAEKPTEAMKPPVQAPGRAGRGKAFSQAQ
jgi:hypothetical protein